MGMILVEIRLDAPNFQQTSQINGGLKTYTIQYIRGMMKIKENTTDFKTRRIKSETSGRVESVHVRKGEETSADNILARISMSKCPHSTVMKNMCADCGADLEHEEQHLGITIISIIPVFVGHRSFYK